MILPDHVFERATEFAAGCARDLGSNLMRFSRFHAWLFALLLTGAVGRTVAGAPLAWQPARFLGGSIPQPGTTAVGGGEVFLEVAVTDRGVVTNVRPLRVTPPFAGMMLTAVRSWDFSPALDADARGASPLTPLRVASKVLVGAVFRPPALVGPTLGETPKDVGKAGSDVPFPLSTTMPVYPTHARSGASVLIELHVGADGAVTDATVAQSGPPFDEPARTAALAWRFRPAVVNGRAVPSLVYIVFGFPAPVLG